MKYSVIIEWDNARLSERERAVRMLRELGRQAAEQSDWRPPVKIVFDTEEVDEAVIPTCLAEAGAAIASLDIELIPSSGKTYYQQKNVGFAATDTPIVVFLDSDVIPQSGWLSALLSGFEEPNVGMVSGNTFMSYDSFYERAFALFWFFNLDDRGEGLERTEHFFANNVAFRRELFARFGFPETASFRGQCRVLADQMVKSQVALYRACGAAVEHPPPVDGGHFVWRALCDGHDEVALSEALTRNPGETGITGAARRFKRHMSNANRRVRTEREQVALKPRHALPALGMAAAYYGLKFLGELTTMANPKLIRDNAPL